MGKEHSTVRRARRGCLGGCLVRILMLLGLTAILFVGGCVLGFVQNDPDTGKPYLTVPSSIDVSGLSLDGLQETLSSLKLPSLSWPYSLSSQGLTVKFLPTPSGTAVLVCADGYTLLASCGGNGIAAAAQCFLCGVTRLSAAAAPSADASGTSGMDVAVSLLKPYYLLESSGQTATAQFNSMNSAAQNAGVQIVAPQSGLSFTLGRAEVTVVGPRKTGHITEADDSLSLLVRYGSRTVLLTGGVGVTGEHELSVDGRCSGIDVLVAPGSSTTCGQELLDAAQPKYAVRTDRSLPSDTKIRLARYGTQVYDAKDSLTLTFHTDGTSWTVTK